MEKKRYLSYSRKKSPTKYYLFNQYSKIFLFLIIYFSENIVKIGNSTTSVISLIIEGGGNQQLINDQFNIEPDQVSVNGVTKASYKKTCELEEGLNTVSLTFENEINSCKFMFQNLSNIKEIDLSYTDFSKVSIMEFMFDGYGAFRSCSNLTSIDLSNLYFSN